MSAIETQDELLTTAQAADYLQVSRATIYRWVKDGRLIGVRLGRAYRVPRRSLDVHLALRTRSAIPLRRYSVEEIAEFLRRDVLPEGVRDALDRLPDPAGSVREQLAAAGLLAPMPELEDGLTDAEFEALEAEVDAWLDQLPEPLGLAEAVIADRDGR